MRRYLEQLATLRHTDEWPSLLALVRWGEAMRRMHLARWDGD